MMYKNLKLIKLLLSYKQFKFVLELKHKWPVMIK